MAAAPKVSAGKHRAASSVDSTVASGVAAGQTFAGKPSGGGKPSPTKRAVGGAATGAATGATLGSLVGPGGTAAGAAGGAVVGGGLGVIKGHSEKKAWKSGKSGGGANYQRALIAEFLICTIVLALSPLARGDDELKPAAWMKKGTALCGVFVLLGMVGGIGQKSGKLAASFGALVTLVLLVDQRSIFAKIAERFTAPDADVGEAVGEDVGAAVGGVGSSVGASGAALGGVGSSVGASAGGVAQQIAAVVRPR